MSFEDVMMKRLASCHAEACKEILAGVKSGRSISDAVTDAIEALPAPKTRDLRRWLEDWQAWEEWKNWEDAGWKIVKKGSEIYVVAPYNTPELRDGPTNEENKAGAGVRMMRYIGDSNGHGFADRTADELSRRRDLGRRTVLVTQFHVVKRER